MLKLFCFSALAIVLLAVCSFPQSATATPNFRILQVNDTYKIEGLENGHIGGLARLRTLRKQLEAQGQPLLVLHSGDLLFPSVMSKYLKGGPMVRMLNLLDGDSTAFDPNLIVTLGNHEFDDKDPGVLLGRLAQSDFTWVAGNIRYRTSSNAPGEAFGERVDRVKDSVIRDLGGIKVGIFSLTLDITQPDYATYLYSPEDARRAIVDQFIVKLKEQGAQVIVALTHQNLKDDLWLAKEFPDIHLIVGGHEHSSIQRQVGDTWITKADSDARSAIVHEISVSAGGKVGVTFNKVELDDGIAPDADVQKAVDGQLAELNKVVKKTTGEYLDEAVGKTAYLLEGEETAVRGRETALGNLLTDIYRKRMGTDIAWINGGSIRLNDNIPPGPINNYHVAGIFYYDDDLVTMELTGTQILDVLRNSVSKVHIGDGRFLHVSGLRFCYHVNGPQDDPNYRVEATDVEVQSKSGKAYAPLQLNKTYRIATSIFFWGRGVEDGYSLFAQNKGGTSPKRLDTGKSVSMRKTFLDALAKLPNRIAKAKVEGRIMRLEQ
ncbi:MAG: bifunctional metallophosphatase/5'-nucleotidase [Methylomonas sp.]